MEEQIILSVDLYDNALTEKQGDYAGKPRITGTLRNEDIALRGYTASPTKSTRLKYVNTTRILTNINLYRT